MKKLFILATASILLLLSNFVCGQKDFRNGFIIMNNNDTVYGLINLKSNISNSSECEFIRNETDVVTQSYSPQDIQSYQIENYKRYVSKSVMLNDEEVGLFLECLLDGIVDLYLLADANTELYFIEKEGELYPLIDEVREIYSKGTKTGLGSVTAVRELISGSGNMTYLVNSKQYKGMLKVMFQDNPEIFHKIDNLRLDTKPLVNLAKEYHNNVCTDYACIDYTKLNVARLFIEPYMNYYYATMKLTHSEQKFRSSLLGFGINFRFISSRFNLLSFITGIHYSKNHFSGNGEIPRYLGGVLVSKYDFTFNLDYSAIRIPLIFELSFPFNRIQPSIVAGYNNILILKPEYTASTIEPIYSPYLPDLSDPNKYQMGVTGGIGLRIKTTEKSYLQFKAQYEFRRPVSAEGGSDLPLFDQHKVQSWIFHVGYGIALN